MRKFKKWLLASGMAIGIFCTSALPAFAYTGDTQTVIPEETESTDQTEVAAQEEFQETEKCWTINRRMERRNFLPSRQKMAIHFSLY